MLALMDGLRLEALRAALLETCDHTGVCRIRGLRTLRTCSCGSENSTLDRKTCPWMESNAAVSSILRE